MKKFTWVSIMGTTLPKWEPMGVKYSKFLLLDPVRRSEI
jgi:hypothetical protein